MILDVSDLHKTYRRGAVTALDGMTMQVRAGGVHGLVGPNGAGKSTLLRIVLGLVRASRGGVRLFGERAGDPRLLRRTGSLIETPRFYPFMTGRQTLRVLARTSGLGDTEIPALLDRVGLTTAADRRTSSYSLGMKQRLGVAAALLGAPELLILDEPLNGLDPAGIREMRALVADLAAEGMTVLMSSHVLSEVERVCDRVTIIHSGRAVAEGAVAELLAQSRALRIDARPLDAALAVARRAAPDARIADGAVWANVERAAAPALLSALTSDGVELFEARWTGQDLEALFFEATGDRGPETAS